MTKLIISAENSENGRPYVIDTAATYSAAELTTLYGPDAHAILFAQVREVKHSPASYFLPRGEFSNAKIERPFKATKPELEAMDEKYLTRHRALMLSYTMLRVQGYMPQVAYIVTFADKSEQTPALIDRAARGAEFIEGTKFFKTEFARPVDQMDVAAGAREIIKDVDRQLKFVSNPEDTRPLYELRGKLGIIVDRAAEAAKKGEGK